MSIRSKILLFFQFVGFGYFVFFQDLLATSFFMLIQFFGFILCLWSIAVMGIGRFNAQPEVKSNATLIKIGPYAKIRNPMYAGLILFFGAGVLGNFNWIGFLVLLGLVVLFLIKISDEEKYLAERFGESYLSYKKTTYRLIPYIF